MRQVHSAVAMLVVSSLLVACGGDDESPGDEGATANDALMLACGEARGALLELELMDSGRNRVDTSTLGFAAGQLRRLAEDVSAADEIRSNIYRWGAALETWSEKRNSIEPRIENGRFVEPDTSELDQALLTELRPIGKRLTVWRAGVCDT